MKVGSFIFWFIFIMSMLTIIWFWGTKICEMGIIILISDVFAGLLAS